MKNKFVLLAIQTGVALSGQNVNETNGGLVYYFYGRGNNQVLAYAPRVELLQGRETPANPLELLGSHFEPLFRFFSGGDKLKFKCENEVLTEFLLNKDGEKPKVILELLNQFEDIDLAVMESNESGGFEVKLYDNFLEAKTEFAPLEWLHSKIMELFDEEDDGDEPQDDGNPDNWDYDGDGDGDD